MRRCRSRHCRPRPARRVWPTAVRSAISVSLSSSKICVPAGTFSTTSAPLAPVRLLAHAVAAGLGLEMLLVAIVDQRVQAVDAFDA